MYQLPLSAGNSEYLPLHEHSAMLMVTGLLHEDLEDQCDTLRGVLEIDPLLATWCVLQAHDQAGIELRSIHSAARWLTRHFIPQATRDTQLKSLQLPPAARQRWRSVTVHAVSTARHVQVLTRRCSVSSVAEAAWLSMLQATQRALQHSAKRNGKAPLPGVPRKWPQWLETACDSPPDTDNDHWGTEANQAESKVFAEEQELWFRPYPEFHSLAPLLIAKLRRLQALEEDFSTTLQEEKLASLQQLAYGASHEINNPLANISTRAQTLMHNESDVDRRRKLLAINEQAFRAYEMIADLMLFAKPPQMETVSLDVREVLQAVRNELTEAARDRDVRIQVQLEAIPHCVGDPVQLGVACKAICQNGLEAMPDGGELTVRCRWNPQASAVQILIQDEGIGLSDFVRRHCFDPFFSGREAGRGLGFGLSKAWRIVERHHGKIEVSSPDGAGTCFIVSLPVAGSQPTLLPESVTTEAP